MILAVDAQLLVLVRDAIDELAECLNKAHGKDHSSYMLLSSASSLMGSAVLYLHRAPSEEHRAAAWKLVEASAAITKDVTPRPEKLQMLLEMKSMFRLS